MTKADWQGITPKEIERLAIWADEHGHGPFHVDFALAIDRLLKEKNLRRGEVSQEPIGRAIEDAHGIKENT